MHVFSIAHPRYPHCSQHAQSYEEAQSERIDVRVLRRGSSSLCECPLPPHLRIACLYSSLGICNLTSPQGFSGRAEGYQSMSVLSCSSQLFSSQCSLEVPVQFSMTLSLQSQCMPSAVASWIGISSIPLHRPQQDLGQGRTSTAKSKITHSPEMHHPVRGWKTTAASVLGRKSPVNIWVSALEARSIADAYSPNK